MRFAFDKDNTRGWSLMTTEERTAYHDKMLAAKTLDECKAIQLSTIRPWRHAPRKKARP
jgi:hypothetical protein